MRLIILIAAFLMTLVAPAQVKPGTVYPDGKPGKDYNLRDNKGKKDGLWVQQWASTRNLSARGNYEHGTPVGTWERYHADGALLAVIVHVKDTTIMDVSMYHEDGKTLAAQGRFVKKKKDGEWKTWDEFGRMLADENYTDSLLNGSARYYYPSGVLLKVEEYKMGEKNGPFTEYYENGRKKAEGSYLRDNREGKYTSWFDNGIIDAEGKYVKGLQDGSWYYNHEDGVPKISLQYKMGQEVKRKYQNGTFKEYYDSNIPKCEYTYEDGKREGPFTEWYDVGEYKAVEASEEDKKVGIVYREKLVNTQVRVTGDYLNDQMEGEIVFYRLNGSIEKIEEWSGGKLVKTRAAAK